MVHPILKEHPLLVTPATERLRNPITWLFQHLLDTAVTATPASRLFTQSFAPPASKAEPSHQSAQSTPNSNSPPPSFEELAISFRDLKILEMIRFGGIKAQKPASPSPTVRSRWRPSPLPTWQWQSPSPGTPIQEAFRTLFDHSSCKQQPVLPHNHLQSSDFTVQTPEFTSFSLRSQFPNDPLFRKRTSPRIRTPNPTRRCHPGHFRR